MVNVVVTNDNVPCWSSVFNTSEEAEKAFLRLIEYYESAPLDEDEVDDVLLDGYFECEGSFTVSIVHPMPFDEFDFDAESDEVEDEVEVEYTFQEKVIEYRATRIVMPKTVVDKGEDAMVNWIHENYDGLEEESLEHSDTIETLLDVTIESY